MLEFLYSVTIYPVEFVIGVLFGIFSDLFGNVGFSIVGVSVAVSALCLPLYAVAERWQSLERDKQKAMKPKIDSIKAVFKGDEQYMILSTYYRQNHYHPIYSLRSTFGLLIQVPFFIAAYHLISTLPNLAGQAFWFIPDLGRPDGLLKIGALSVNILPILMTAVNLTSSIVYTRGFALKDKIQLWVMALLFLFLLYGSPAGLVFYWTLNNLFSLAKNLVYKAKNPVRVAYTIVAVLAVSLTFVYVSRFNLSRIKTLFVEAVCAVVVIAPLAFAFACRLLRVRAAKRVGIKPGAGDIGSARDWSRVFWVSCAACAVFAGLTLPVGLIASSSVEFASALGNKNPLTLVRTTLFQSIGLFLVWPGCLYLLFSGKTRRVFSVIAPIVLFTAIADAWLFRGNYGTISSFLIFDNSNALIASLSQAIASLACLAAVASSVAFLSSGKRVRILVPITAISLVGLVAVASLELPKISREWSAYSMRVSQDVSVGKDDKVYRFSKTGHNVCIIMLDRAIGSFAGDILAEDARLKDSFAGFTWYPNAASFGPNTLLASPAMYGGYDYVPDEINARSEEPLVKKHNEALTVLPRFFTEVHTTSLSFLLKGWE
ncbi:MAG TPA: membrane protein insertase YidC [Treponemataceae bacterium]|nr:membrane protein insertase YidC [Treponemataceae bacterium]